MDHIIIQSYETFGLRISKQGSNFFRRPPFEIQGERENEVVHLETFLSTLLEGRSHKIGSLMIQAVHQPSGTTTDINYTCDSRHINIIARGLGFIDKEINCKRNE